MAVTSEATGISERLMNTVLKEGKESFGKGKLCFFTHKGKKYVKKIIVHVDPSKILLLNFMLKKKGIL